jgi:hypothetical protein
MAGVLLLVLTLASAAAKHNGCPLVRKAESVSWHDQYPDMPQVGESVRWTGPSPGGEVEVGDVGRVIDAVLDQPFLEIIIEWPGSTMGHGPGSFPHLERLGRPETPQE